VVGRRRAPRAALARATRRRGASASVAPVRPAAGRCARAVKPRRAARRRAPRGAVDSRPWVAALGAVAAVLAALLAFDLARPDHESAAGARIVAEWDAGKVRGLRIERPDRVAVILERAGLDARPADAPARDTGSASGSPAAAAAGAAAASRPRADATGEHWVLRLPGAHEARVPADPSAVRDLLGTIELLSAIRRDDGAIGTARLTLVIEREAAPPIRLLIAGTPGPTDRVWLARSGRAGRFLVDGYAARAVDLDADALRDHRPFRGRTTGATRVELGPGAAPTALSGPPWRVELPGGAARADPAAVQDLLDQLDRLRIDQFASQPAQPPTRLLALDARAGRSELSRRGTCAGGASLVDTPAGLGCARLPATLIDASSDPRRLIDRRLIGVSVDDVTALHLGRGGRTIDVQRAASPDALREWLTRWRGAAEGPLVPTAADAAPVATVELELAGGARERLTISRAGGGRLAARRDGEPVALLLHPWADAHLDPAPYRFRSLDLLSYEPSSLRAATARRAGRVFEAIDRGDTMEEWRTQATGAAVPLPAVEALRQAVGFLRAERFAAPEARAVHGLSPPRRTVELVFDPPPGAADPLRHILVIGAPTSGGCFARLDSDPVVFELSAARCAAVLGPWATR